MGGDSIKPPPPTSVFNTGFVTNTVEAIGHWSLPISLFDRCTICHAMEKKQFDDLPFKDHITIGPAWLVDGQNIDTSIR